MSAVRPLACARPRHEMTTMKLDLSTLESWLWDAACVIRGPVDAPKFKDYILPLIFLKPSVPTWLRHLTPRLIRGLLLFPWVCVS